MNPIASPRHPFKAVVAVVAMAAAVHGVCARAADVPGVNVVGQLPFHVACPGADPADLADELASAWNDAPRSSTVVVRFKVQGGHVYDVVPDTDSAHTFHQIRHAVHGLSCHAGDDQAHAVHLLVRFVDGDADSRLASVVLADDPDAR